MQKFTIFFLKIKVDKQKFIRFVGVIDLRIPEKNRHITVFLFSPCLTELTELSRGGSYHTLIIPVVTRGSKLRHVRRVSVACVTFTIKLLSENRRNTLTPLQIKILAYYPKLNYVHKSQKT